MNVLYVDDFGNCYAVKNTDVIPQIGNKVGLFNYVPRPRVSVVLIHPPRSETEKFKFGSEFDILVVVK